MRPLQLALSLFNFIIIAVIIMLMIYFIIRSRALLGLDFKLDYSIVQLIWLVLWNFCSALTFSQISLS